MEEKNKKLMMSTILGVLIVFVGLSKTILFSHVIIIFLAWLWVKKIDKGYVIMLLLFPLTSLTLTVMTFPKSDFYEYIVVLLLACISFSSSWIFAALNGEPTKVELSMYIVFGIVILFFMFFMAFIEVLPTDLLELYLKPLLIKGSTYDIWSRPPYQIAHFIIMMATFPYIGSFIISKIIIKLRSNRNLDIR